MVGLITSNKGWGSLQKKDKKVKIWGGAKSIKILIYLSGFNLFFVFFLRLFKGQLTPGQLLDKFTKCLEMTLR